MKKILLTILPLLLIVGCELKNGIYNDFYPNGQKRFEKNFSNGVEDGKWNHWYEDGVLKIKGNYKDGVEDGKWVYFYSNGQKFLEITYKEGVKIEETYWDEDGTNEITPTQRI